MYDESTMSEATKTFGEQLRRLRQAEGFSLDDLASASGISRAYLWKLERKPDANPSLELLQKLAGALGTTVSDLAAPTATRVENMEIPESLRECKKLYELEDADIADLARIRFRGGHPLHAEDWYLLYLQLKRATGTQDR